MEKRSLRLDFSRIDAVFKGHIPACALIELHKLLVLYKYAKVVNITFTLAILYNVKCI